MKLHQLLAITLLLLTSGVHAQHYMAGDIHVEQVYARATVPHQPTGAVYLSLENTGAKMDRLVALSSPVAARAEIHIMTMEGNVMKMREVDGIDLKPDTRIEMKPGDGYHIMLSGLKQALKAGEKFPVTLIFERAGKLEILVPVQAVQSKGADAKHKHHH